MRSSMHAWIHSIPGALFGLGESILFVWLSLSQQRQAVAGIKRLFLDCVVWLHCTGNKTIECKRYLVLITHHACM
jgi:hypothetical protein